ncbi:MAG TPA: DNA polymerase III subunit delta' [Candidatus Omnitrophota bacterium]|nr:DNA polymerase III subunit delta' [Candidatus Omnitrophota bacterium]
MLLLKDIKGQNNAVKSLTTAIAMGRVANGYLFSGASGVGKALTVRAFLSELYCVEKSGQGACLACSPCRRIWKNEHPDVVWVKPEETKSIKIEQIVTAKEKLHLKPYESERTACIIEEAHMMTREAANALLKVLEEPPGKAVLILVTNKRELLLPTVISRCVDVKFYELASDTVKSILMRETGADLRTADIIAALSGGSPGRAIEMFKSGFLERRQKVMNMLDEIVSSKYPHLNAWDSEKKETLIEDIELLVALLRDVVISKEGVPGKVIDRAFVGTPAHSYFSALSSDRIGKAVARLVEMKVLLEGNLNPKIAAQALAGELIG